MRLGIAEIDQQSVAEILGNIPLKALDDLRTGRLVRPHHLPQVFRIKLGGERGRPHEITEHDGELAPFSVKGKGCDGWSSSLRRGDGRGGKRLSWRCRLGSTWDGRRGYVWTTSPNQHAAVLILCDLLRVEEFVLEGLKSMVIQVKLHLQC